MFLYVCMHACDARGFSFFNVILTLHLFIILLLILCEGCTYDKAHVWRSQDNMWKSVLSFCHEDSHGELNSCVKLSSQCLNVQKSFHWPDFFLIQELLCIQSFYENIDYSHFISTVSWCREGCYLYFKLLVIYWCGIPFCILWLSFVNKGTTLGL